MQYVTEQEGKSLSFNYSYKQCFFRDPKRNHGMPEYVVVSDFMKEDDDHRRVGLEVLLYLRQFCFATHDMLAEMLAVKRLPVNLLDDLLESYVEKYLINFFALVEFDAGELPEDAFRIYCLDSGGIHVLTHFSTYDAVSWLSSDNIRGVELVNKYLVTGLFANTLMKNKGKSLTSFIPVFDASIGRRTIRLSATFTMMNGYTPWNYLFEVVRDYDLPGGWIKKCGEQISVFSHDKHWIRYFDTEPIYMLLCENEDVAQRAAEILGRHLEDQEVLIATDGYLAGQPNTLFTIDSGEKKLVPSKDKLLLP